MDNVSQEKISLFKSGAKTGQMTCYDLAVCNKAAAPSVGRKLCIVLQISFAITIPSWQGAHFILPRCIRIKHQNFRFYIGYIQVSLIEAT